jgi:hypothetical protein
VRRAARANVAPSERDRAAERGHQVLYLRRKLGADAAGGQSHTDQGRTISSAIARASGVIK